MQLLIVLGRREPAFALSDFKGFAKSLAGALTSLGVADGISELFGSNEHIAVDSVLPQMELLHTTSESRHQDRDGRRRYGKLTVLSISSGSMAVIQRPAGARLIYVFP